MLNPLRLLSAVCLLAATACAAPQLPYQPAPRPVIDPLPADLRLTDKDRQLCRRLLSRFSPTEQTLQESCDDISASSTGSTPAKR